jgi:HD-GYP domain-containing protein (c-di-GMP phosphodiesterase class II)
MIVNALPALDRPALEEELELSVHGRSVALIAMQLAEALGFNADDVRGIGLAGALHDVGKRYLDPSILAKEGPLDLEDWAQIRRHPELGERILRRVGLRDAARWVRWHHERPDGHGYPDGLRGDEIPREAAILAVADAFDAMITNRCYGQQLDHDDAIHELCRCAGTQFDPTVVAAALRCDLHVSDTRDAHVAGRVG